MQSDNNIKVRRIMNINRFVKTMSWAMPEFVSLNVVEDSQACDSIQSDWYIEGYFNPYFEEDMDMEDRAIEINVVCHMDTQLIEDQELMTEELFTVYAHELIHFQQYREGRFNFTDFDQNEEEANAREKEWKKPWHKVMADKLRGG